MREKIPKLEISELNVSENSVWVVNKEDGTLFCMTSPKSAELIVEAINSYEELKKLESWNEHLQAVCLGKDNIIAQLEKQIRELTKELGD